MTATEQERHIRDLRDAIGRGLASALAPERTTPDELADLLRRLKRNEAEAEGKAKHDIGK